MVVVAHPGDEAFGFGGAIAQAAASGAYVSVVCVTRGHFDTRLANPAPAPGGRNRSYQQPTVWRNLDTVREDELRRSVGLLGVRVLRMLDYSEESLAGVDFAQLVGRIVEPIRMHRPEVILGFGPDGISGDADHVIVGRATDEAFRLAGEPLSHEDDLEEDQVAWRAAKLYHLVVLAGDLEPLGGAAPSDYGSTEGSDSLALDLGELASVKLAAITRHVSQTGSGGPFREWPPGARDRFLGVERYRLARSLVPSTSGADAGLWDGLA